MENILLKYMDIRFNQGSEMLPATPAPFITISREFGCPSKLIANKLTTEINKMQKAHSWHFINKEIIEESANKLNVDPMKIKSVLSAEKRGIMDDVISSFSSKYYINSISIRKTISDIIKSIAIKGYVIIVGRGSVAITKGFSNSLHIRLQAPLEWRINEVCRVNGLSRPDAEKMANDTDTKRAALIESFLKCKPDQSIFDLIFNCKTMDVNEIVKSIIYVMELKKMI